MTFADYEFNQSMNRASYEVMLLNKAEGYNRWKSVSMDREGNWYADENHEMTANLDMGCYMASSGLDILLKEKYTDTPINHWLYSCRFVPFGVI